MFIRFIIIMFLPALLICQNFNHAKIQDQIKNQVKYYSTQELKKFNIDSVIVSNKLYKKPFYSELNTGFFTLMNIDTKKTWQALNLKDKEGVRVLHVNEKLKPIGQVVYDKCANAQTTTIWNSKNNTSMFEDDQLSTIYQNGHLCKNWLPNSTQTLTFPNYIDGGYAKVKYLYRGVVKINDKEFGFFMLKIKLNRHYSKVKNSNNFSDYESATSYFETKLYVNKESGDKFIVQISKQHNKVDKKVTNLEEFIKSTSTKKYIIVNNNKEKVFESSKYDLLGFNKDGHDKYGNVKVQNHFKVFKPIKIVDKVDSSLIKAVKSSDINKVKELIAEKVDLEQTDSFGRTALIHAVSSNNVEVTKLLIDNKVNINVKDVGGQTALMWATYNMSIKDTSIAKEIDKSSTQNLQLRIDIPEAGNDSSIPTIDLDIDISKYINMAEEKKVELRKDESMNYFLNALDITMLLIKNNADTSVEFSDQDYHSWVNKEEASKIISRLKTDLSKSDDFDLKVEK